MMVCMFSRYFYQNLGIVCKVLHCLYLIGNILVTSKMANSYFKNSSKEKKKHNMKDESNMI